MIETTAVLDRFERKRAVLVLDDRRREVVCDPERLAVDGREPDAVFAVRVDGDTLIEATYLPDETAARRDRARSRFDRLSERLGGGTADRVTPQTDDESAGDGEWTDDGNSDDRSAGDGERAGGDESAGDESSTSGGSTDGPGGEGSGVSDGTADGNPATNDPTDHPIEPGQADDGKGDDGERDAGQTNDGEGGTPNR